MSRRVLIVGCGASGMMAAIAAAKAGADVTVLEAMKLPGRKLLMTGNSRCNLTNTAPRMAASYLSENGCEAVSMAASVLGQFSVNDTLDLFHQMGLLTTVEHGTYVYPLSGQSGSVLEILLQQMKELGVRLRYACRVAGLERTEKGWVVLTDGWKYEADAVILACGSKAAPKTGSDGSGYLLAKALGLQVTEVVPALTGIAVQDGRRLLPPLAGVRMTAGVSAWADGIPLCRDIGQLQFTSSDLSGIVVFQVSRKVSRALEEGKQVELRLDLIPAFTEDEVETILAHYGQNHPEAPVRLALCGLLPQQLIQTVLDRWTAGNRQRGERIPDTAGSMDKLFIRSLSELIKDFRLKADHVRGFDSCQVCAGGIALSEVDEKTLACRRQALSGLYIAGELLDLDGPCGGYNLQWAWSSGYVAGKHAAEGC